MPRKKRICKCGHPKGDHYVVSITVTRKPCAGHGGNCKCPKFVERLTPLEAEEQRILESHGIRK